MIKEFVENFRYMDGTAVVALTLFSADYSTTMFEQLNKRRQNKMELDRARHN